MTRSFFCARSTTYDPAHAQGAERCAAGKGEAAPSDDGRVVARNRHGRPQWSEDNMLYMERRRAEGAAWQDIGREMGIDITTALRKLEKWRSNGRSLDWPTAGEAGRAAGGSNAGWPERTMTPEQFANAFRRRASA
ncbi:hypothetical protein ACM64Y_00525 [Novispirillum sp. DQ9]|uniref:hypothetical protein n=1 Tax=Novispirillum sp. DQ9 TaxID=3398612 RepID=UPI003C7AAD1F